MFWRTRARRSGEDGARMTRVFRRAAAKASCARITDGRRGAPLQCRERALRRDKSPTSCVFKEALVQSTCADWRADFSSGEARKAQEYFVYFKGSADSIRRERMSSKFLSDQGAKVQEYFVYFNLLQRRAGKNLPTGAEAGLISVSQAFRTKPGGKAAVKTCAGI